MPYRARDNRLVLRHPHAASSPPPQPLLFRGMVYLHPLLKIGLVRALILKRGYLSGIACTTTGFDFFHLISCILHY